jgi:LacI family transcriptional regulator
MGRMREVTIYDIAKALHLSPSTISRALSGSRFVHNQTRLKIEKAASELGYRQKPAERATRPSKSRLIGAIVTQLNTTIASCVVSGTEAIARQLRYSVIVNQSMNKPEFRARSLEILKDRNVDGVLVTSAYFQEYDSLNELAKLQIPLVVVEGSSLLPNRPRKQISDFENTFELTNYLIEKGCKRIAYLSVDLERSRHAKLLSGYRQALQRSALAEADKFVFNTYDVNTSWIEMCRILVSMTPRPDGVIISNNVITAVAFTASNGSSTGDEFWVTCRKGNLSAQSQTLVELGKLAGSLLICFIEWKHTSPSGIIRSLHVFNDDHPA